MPASPLFKNIHDQKIPKQPSNQKNVDNFIPKNRRSKSEKYKMQQDNHVARIPHDELPLNTRPSSPLSLISLDCHSVVDISPSYTNTLNFGSTRGASSNLSFHKPIISGHSSSLGSVFDFKQHISPSSDFLHFKVSNFIFSYDLSPRTPNSPFSIKRLEDDLKKHISNYMSSYLSYHTSMTNNGLTSRIRGFTQKEISDFSQLASEAFLKTPLIGGLFSQANQPTTPTQVYSKIISQISVLLSKSHLKTNSILPLRRQILALLFIPFASRPIDGIKFLSNSLNLESLCLAALASIQNILVEFPCETSKQLYQMLNWCLKALHVTSPNIINMVLEKVQFLIGQGLRRPNLLFSSNALNEVLTLLLHQQALSVSLNHDSFTLKKIDDLIANLLLHKDKLLDERFFEHHGGNFSRGLVLSNLLKSSIQAVQTHAIKILSEFEWPSLVHSSSRKFYQAIVTSVQGVLFRYINNPTSVPYESIHLLATLVFKYFPAKYYDGHWLDSLSWQLVLQNALLILAIAFQTETPQLLQSHLLDSTRVYLNDCIHHNMEGLLIAVLKSSLSEWSIPISVAVFSSLTLHCLDKSNSEKVLSETLPSFYNRYCLSPYQSTLESLQFFFVKLKSVYPLALYGPLLSLIPIQNPQGASRLCSWVAFLSEILSVESFFFTELDLICVVLFNSMGKQKPYALGQVVFMNQFISAIRDYRIKINASRKKTQSNTEKFLLDMEQQISLYLASQHSLNHPEPHPVIKHLIILILHEIRLTTTSSTRPVWLKYLVKWTCSNDSHIMVEYDFSFVLGELEAVYHLMRRQSCSPNTQISLSSYSLPRIVYRTSDSFTSSFTQPVSTSLPNKSTDGTMLQDFTQLFSMIDGSAFFSLLTLVYFHLTDNEFTKALPFIWNHGLNTKKMQGEPHAQLLLLLSGERPATDVDRFVKVQLQLTKKRPTSNSLGSIANLFGSRKSLIRYLVIPDPAGKPFRRAGSNLSFVTTTVGTYEPVVQESKWLEKLKLSGTSLDDIKSIQSLGWDTDETDGKDDSSQGATYPISLASSTFDEICQVEQEYDSSKRSLMLQQHKPLLASMTGCVFSHLTSETTRMIDSFFVARANLLNIMMRDEPSWFLRLLLGSLETSQGDVVESCLNDISHLINIKPKLPLQFTFHTFNYLSGWLKRFYRDIQSQDLAPLSQIIPLLSRLVPSAYDVSLRELRKAKLDIVYLFDGRLTLPDRNNLFRIPLSQFIVSLTNPFSVKFASVIPKPLFDLVLFRVGQSLFMTRVLNRSPHDANSLALTLAKFEPISWVFASPNQKDHVLGLNFCQKNYGDRTLSLPKTTTEHLEFRSFSGLHSHAWLGFIEKLFEHTGSKESINFVQNAQDIKLETILDGINYIMVSHPNDVILLGRIIRLLVRIVLQFRRYFNIKSGYSLFIVALFQVYFISQNDKCQEGIKFVLALFFNLHQESFVFQMLGSIVPLILDTSRTHPNHTSLMSQMLYDWLLCLEIRPEVDTFDLLETISKISLSQLPYEETDVRSQSHLANFITSHIRPKPLYQEGTISTFKQFLVADSLRLFVTIIAYDPGSLRSEQFIIILQYLLPFLMKNINASDLVDLAIKSIIPVFVQFFKNRTLLSRFLGKDDNFQIEDDLIGLAVGSMYGINWPQNDRSTIRIELFRLIGMLLDLGGELLPSEYDELICILKSVIKTDSTFTSDEGPFLVFMNCVIYSTKDAVLKADIALKTVQSVSSIIFTCRNPANIADLLVGASTLINEFIGEHQNQSSNWYLLLPVFLKFGCDRFSELDPTQPEGPHIIGQCLVKLFNVMSLCFPHEVMVELKRLNLNVLSLAYVFIPLCCELTTDDVFIYNNQGLLPAQKLMTQQIWVALLSAIVNSVVSTDTTATRAPVNEHPLEASLSYLLGLVGIKVIMIRAQKLIFESLPNVTCKVTHLIQTYVFDPLINNTYSNRSKIPLPVFLYAAWKLNVFWDKSQHSIFSPVFADSIHTLKCFTQLYETRSISVMSSHPIRTSASYSLSQRNSCESQTQTKSSYPNPKSYPGVPSITKLEDKARKSYKLVKNSGLKFPKLRPKLDMPNEPLGIWSTVYINNVLNQLEKQTFNAQSTNLNSYNVSTENSNYASPQLSPSYLDINPKSPGSIGSHLNIPGFPSNVNTNSRPLSDIYSPPPIINVENDLIEELDFLLSCFNFPTPLPI